MADKPVTREEKYLAYLTGDYKGELPKPITRKEKYLYELCFSELSKKVGRIKTPLHFVITLLTVRIFSLGYSKCPHCIRTRDIAIINALSHMKHRYDLR